VFPQAVPAVSGGLGLHGGDPVDTAGGGIEMGSPFHVVLPLGGAQQAGEDRDDDD